MRAPVERGMSGAADYNRKSGGDRATRASRRRVRDAPFLDMKRSWLRGLTSIYALLYIYTVMQLDVFETLADPTRRRIVQALRKGEQPVNDLVAQAGIHQSGVSRHLRILQESGFVAVRPDGQRRLYSLKLEPFLELDGWLAHYRKMWESKLDRFGVALERQRAGRQDKERRNPRG